MENFQIERFRTITGIAAASGLVLNGNSLFIISDSSTYLYEYQLTEALLNKIPLQENPADTLSKKEKLDLESICKINSKLVIFGSGSKENRMAKFIFNPKNKKIKQKNNSKILERCIKIANLKEDELNIEGVIRADENTFFFQRGNGSQQINGIFIQKNNNKKKISFTPVALPQLKNHNTTFTDAVLVENKIYFLAAAEASDSTYLDGEILGSILGRLDLETFALESFTTISETKKFEGLTLFSNSASEIAFLLCEDADTEVLETSISKITFQK